MRSKNVLFAVLLLISLLSVGASSLWAQSGGTGAITGTVTDPSGAVVPNVTVTSTSVDTGQVRTVTTGANGSYQINLLTPGQYRVRYEAAGFQSVEIPSVTVTVTETGTLNQQLTMGAQTQQVTVEANVETVQTASSTVGTVVNTKVITDLPLSTRNYTNLIGLSAGANGSVQNATAIGKGAGNVAVNGSNTSQNTWQMDGVFITNYSGRNDLQETGSFGSIAIPNPDALQEFKIQTSTFDASYGRNPGANVNVVTKSGTNSYHGAAFEFFRNTVLNANDFFLNRSHQPEGVLNQNQYGGVFGGPVKKDKLFFFVSYQETSQKNGYSVFGLSTNVTLPPIPLLANRGNCVLGATTIAACSDGGVSATFAQQLGANICPAGQASAAAINSGSIANSQNQVTATSYFTDGTPGKAASGAQVACDGSNINPVALRILQLKLANGSYYIPSSLALPASQITGKQNYGTTSYSIPALYAEHQGLGNWDYVINAKHTLAGRYFYSADPTTAPFEAGLGGGLGNIFLPGTPAGVQYRNQNAVLKLTSVLTNNLVNEARISFQRNGETIQPAQVFTSSQVGMQQTQPNINYLPFMNVGSLFSYGSTSSALVSNKLDQYQVADQISWTHGKHSIRAGFERDNEFFNFNLAGFPIGQTFSSSFGDWLLGLPGCSPAISTAACQASGLANTTTGTPFSFFSSITVTGRTPATGSQHYILGKSYSAFVQDDFKVSQRLTLNLGLRWEYDSPNTQQNGNSGVWPSLINAQPVPGSGCIYNTVSYGLGAAGTGCSFAGFVLAANYNAAKTGVPVPAGVYINNTNSVYRNSPPWDNFAPRLGFAWQPTSSNRFVVRGGAGYFYDRVIAGLIQASFSQAVPTLISFAGTGASLFASSEANPYPTTPLGFLPRWVNTANGTSSNINVNGGSPIAQNFVTPLVYEYNLNVQYEFLPSWVLEIGYVGSHGIHQFLAYPINGAQLASVANPINGATSNTTNGVNGPNDRVPYLGFQALTGSTATTSNFKYNSFQATVRKQFSHGLTMQAAYTWSRGFTTMYTGNPNASFTNNVPVISAYTLNPQYRPQRLTVNYNYNLPFGQHTGLMEKLAGGWSLSGVTTIQGGQPMTITDSRGGTVFGSPLAGTAQYAAGMGPANVGVAGSTDSKAQLGAHYLNPNAFGPTLASTTLTGCTTPTVSVNCTGTLFGNSGFGIVLGPGQNNWDMSLSKITTVGGLRENATLTFRAEFFNTFNHPQFSNPILTFNTTATFGTIPSASVNQRLMQLALKYSF